MRYAILSDIHANLPAFEAVLEDIEKKGGVGKIWHLGDMVGYGPDPHECIELLRRYDHLNIAGNHDWGAIAKIDLAVFNPDAAEASRWTAEQLDRADVEYLENLPLTLEEGDFTLAHGSPRNPIWEYLISSSLAGENFSCFQTRCCLVGHSHLPLVYVLNEDGTSSGSRLLPDTEISAEHSRMIINPGAVGQPRDGNPQASYAIYDSDCGIIRPYRVAYDIGKTQARMKEYGLPVGLWTRLSLGI